MYIFNKNGKDRPAGKKVYEKYVLFSKDDKDFDVRIM